MFEFFHVLFDPGQVFLRRALFVGLLASVATGIIGSYVVVRRITYIAGGIAHAIFGGLGIAYYLRQEFHMQVYIPFSGWQPLHPLHGALIAALLSAIVIGVVSLHARQREDTIISALWALGMAVGVLFMNATSGYSQDLMSYLFGSVVLASAREIWLLVGLDVVVVALALLFYKQFFAVCFDEEFARLRGLRVEAYYLLLLCLIALTVVLLISVVGIIMVIALFTLPVAIAGHFTRTLWQMMALAVLISMVLTTAGLAISYPLDWQAGATTIVLASVAYLAFLIPRRGRQRSI